MRKFTIIIASLFLGLQACSVQTTQTNNTDEIHSENAFAEQKISAGHLGGLYLNAHDKAPIALIVPGSGPTDKDGNNSMGFQSNASKHLAHQLAAKGISTVRVDKRGMYSSAKAGNPNAVTLEIYTKDYQDWIDAIKHQTGAPCVFLIGHSEGGLMVSSTALDRTDVCGLILVSSVGRSMGDVLREQLKANPANSPILEQAFGTITKLENGQHVDTEKLHPALLSLFHEPVQDFLISIMGVDPAELAAQVKQRTLIIQGKNDIQVSETDAQLLHEATQGKLVLLDDVNHILKIAPKGRRENIKTYSDPDLPVADGVIDAIANFMLAKP